jgi:hypothetical protein
MQAHAKPRLNQRMRPREWWPAETVAGTARPAVAPVRRPRKARKVLGVTLKPLRRKARRFPRAHQDDVVRRTMGHYRLACDGSGVARGAQVVHAPKTLLQRRSFFALARAPWVTVPAASVGSTARRRLQQLDLARRHRGNYRSHLRSRGQVRAHDDASRCAADARYMRPPQVHTGRRPSKCATAPSAVPSTSPRFPGGKRGEVTRPPLNSSTSSGKCKSAPGVELHVFGICYPRHNAAPRAGASWAAEDRRHLCRSRRLHIGEMLCKPSSQPSSAW